MILIKKVIILFLLLIPFSSAEIENYNDYSSLIIDYNFNTEIELSGGTQLSYLIANLTLFPLESDRQSIINLDPVANPSAEIDESYDILTYTWNEYSSSLDITVNSKIETKNIIHKLNHVPFPIIDLDEEYEYYLQEGEKININDEIIDKAAEIISGENDLYTVVFKLAEWTRNNIEYDLNTLTEKAALESSWVLENRNGVCDEITSLFISFCRSVGIPARYVSGTAYTNLNYNFGNHAWAEVYFPGYGWVPYDITFGEYAWLNPAHIEFTKTLDSGTVGMGIKWSPQQIDATISPLSLTSEVVTEGEKIDSLFDIDVKVLVDKVGPGSYVPFMVTVNNPFNKYISNTIFISKAPSQLRTNENTKPIMLKPNQEKSSFWIIKIPRDAEPGYVYTSTIEAQDIFGSIDDDTLEFSVQYDVFTQDEAKELIEELEEEQDFAYSEDLSLNCFSSKTYYYSFEEININCDIQNTGNTLIRGLEVCLFENCQIIDLNIAQKKDLLFEHKDPKVSLVVSAKNGGIEVYSFMNVLVLDAPDLEISELEFKSNIGYDEEFDISFVLSSEAEIKNLEIKLNDLESINIKKDKESIKLSLKSKGKYFLDKVNVILTYEDEYGNEFSLEKTKEILVTNIPWYAKIIRFFRRVI